MCNFVNIAHETVNSNYDITIQSDKIDRARERQLSRYEPRNL